MEQMVQTDIYTSAGNILFADNFRFQMKEIGIHINVSTNCMNRCCVEQRATNRILPLSSHLEEETGRWKSCVSFFMITIPNFF